MSKETRIEVITYEQERLNFFTKAMNLAQKRYNRLFKIFKDDPYLSEGTTMVSDAGREMHFYHDVVEMLENGYRKQSEGHWFILEYEYFTCSECGYYHPNGCDSTREAKENLADGKAPNYCPDCGAKMKGGDEE